MQEGQLLYFYDKFISLFLHLQYDIIQSYSSESQQEQTNYFLNIKDMKYDFSLHCQAHGRKLRYLSKQEERRQWRRKTPVSGSGAVGALGRKYGNHFSQPSYQRARRTRGLPVDDPCTSTPLQKSATPVLTLFNVRGREDQIAPDTGLGGSSRIIKLAKRVLKIIVFVGSA